MSSLETIKVSIIIPVYNTSMYLKKSILSALNQTYRNMQIIVINDGSTDNSEAIIQDLLIDYSFEYYKKSNGGLSSARNYGLKHVEGNYVFFLDSDDFLEPDAIEYLVKNLDGSDIIVGKYRYVYENAQSKEAEDFHMLSFKDRVPSEAESFIYIFGEKSGLNACNKLINTSLLNNSSITFQPTKEILAEDMLFNLKFLAYEPQFKAVNHITYNYLQNCKSLTHTYEEGLSERYSNLVMDYYLYQNRNDALLIYVICNGINTVCGQQLPFRRGIKELNNYGRCVNKLLKKKSALKVIKSIPFNGYKIDYSISIVLLGKLNIVLYIYQKLKRKIFGARWLK